MNINLRIERVVLEGLPLSSADGRAVRVAIETELARSLRERDVSAGSLASSAMPAVKVASIRYANAEGPLEVGVQVAAAVHGAIFK